MSKCNLHGRARGFVRWWIPRLVGSALALVAVACDEGERAGDSSAEASEPAEASAEEAREGPAPCPGASSSEIVLETPTGDIDGSLLLPAGCGPFEVVLIHAGSGPTDRNGNSPDFRNNSLRLLAEGLTDRGLAAVRFDKRGVAASADAAPPVRDLRVDMYVDDAAAWVQMLAEDERFAGVTIAGHSEGSLIGMLAARKSPVAAFASIAGPGRPVADVFREQAARRFSGPLLAEVNAILSSLEAGIMVPVVSPELYALYHPSLQPYLISLFRHDPAELIGTLEVPIVIVQGTTDIQVTLEDAKLLAAAAPQARLMIIKGMNHMLKAATLDLESQWQTYVDPSLPVVPALVDGLAEWLDEVR